MGELGLHNHGEAALFDLLLDRHLLPVRNFRATWAAELEHCRTGLTGAATAFTADFCGSCTVGCRRTAGNVPCPDLRARSAFCSLSATGDYGLALACWKLCLHYGLDPVETAAVIACYLEIEDISPRAAALTALIEGMVSGKGPGRELAAGARAYADRHGRPETAMTAGNRALPPVDPRGALGHALSLCVSTCGPDEFQALSLAHEILRKPVATDRFALEGKARLNVISENAGAAADSLCFCPWFRLAVGGEEMARALQAVTGLECDARRLALCGQKTIMAEARLAQGEHEQWPLHSLPPVFFSEPGTPGPGLDIPPLDRSVFERALQRYISIRIAAVVPECEQ
jgi:aldehyde:ferredoxin oxidoreductase